jgi:ATP-dependent protease ClpP protease subunit
MKYVFFSALLVSSVLLSGHIAININHHISLPSELSSMDTVTVTDHRLAYALGQSEYRQVVDIRLGDVIRDEFLYKDVTKALQEASNKDEVIFHIAGYGGEVDTVFELINNVKETKAHTVMIVEAPSYSGHAYLATAGNELRMLPYTFLMFHTSSGYGQDCNQATGTDRTVSNVEHCMAFMKTHLYEVNTYLNSVTFLTANEKYQLSIGHDVYITSTEYYSRLNGNPAIDGSSTNLVPKVVAPTVTTDIPTTI